MSRPRKDELRDALQSLDAPPEYLEQRQRRTPGPKPRRISQAAMQRRLVDATMRLEFACGLDPQTIAVLAREERAHLARGTALRIVYGGGYAFEPRRVLLRYVDRIARLLDQLRCAQAWAEEK